MTFKEATERMRRLGFTLNEMADGLGIGGQTIRTMRLEPDAASYRTPVGPDRWRPAFDRLARERIDALESFMRDAGE